MCGPADETVAYDGSQVAETTPGLALLDGSTEENENLNVKHAGVYADKNGYNIAVIRPDGNNRFYGVSDNYESNLNFFAEVISGTAGFHKVDLLADPDSPKARVDRLKAAQIDTGFKLFDVVRNRDNGQIGQIVGFGRINDAKSLDSSDAERVLLVQTDKDYISAVGLSVLDFIASPAIPDNEVPF